MHRWPIVRDVIIVWFLTGIGGFVVGFGITVATGSPPKHTQGYMLAIATSNFLLGTVAFTIVGCLTSIARWRHLVIVAALAWLTSLVNVAFLGTTMSQWIGSAVFIAVMMGIGGGLSYLFKTTSNPLRSDVQR